MPDDQNTPPDTLIPDSSPTIFGVLLEISSNFLV